MVRDLFATIGLVSVIAYCSVWAVQWWEMRYGDVNSFWNDHSVCKCDNPKCRFHAF